MGLEKEDKHQHLCQENQVVLVLVVDFLVLVLVFLLLPLRSTTKKKKVSTGRARVDIHCELDRAGRVLQEEWLSTRKWMKEEKRT